MSVMLMVQIRFWWVWTKLTIWNIKGSGGLNLTLLQEPKKDMRRGRSRNWTGEREGCED